MKSGILETEINDVIKHIKEKDFAGKTILITGITGLVGSLLAKTLLKCNAYFTQPVYIIGIARNQEKAQSIFYDDLQNKYLQVYYTDIIDLKWMEEIEHVDYILHTASATSSKFFVSNPVETIHTTYMGTRNVLELARKLCVKKVIYVSSMEVYGVVLEKGRKTEEELGKIDILNVRSCYSEGKRLAENLCKAYADEYGVDVSIARLAQTFGPGVSATDNRVFMQFARSAIDKTDIVLHTEGKSYGNYCYSMDMVSALLFLLQNGVSGEAYNVVNESSTLTIAEMAQMVCHCIAGDEIKVVFDIEERGKTGYAPDTQLHLSASKINKLGWKARNSLEESYRKLIQYLIES